MRFEESTSGLVVSSDKLTVVQEDYAAHWLSLLFAYYRLYPSQVPGEC
jgi:hypothetical protein